MTSTGAMLGGHKQAAAAAAQHAVAASDDTFPDDYTPSYEVSEHDVVFDENASAALQPLFVAPGDDAHLNEHRDYMLRHLAIRLSDPAASK